mgnify:CR=1 FL=1
MLSIVGLLIFANDRATAIAVLATGALNLEFLCDPTILTQNWIEEFF